ncbi:type VI secretion protein [Pseudomonas sp. 10-1B]|uniref:type VI secretion system protein TssA n=1 Tax=Pseudomonas sp. 10-1B TaxID=1546029 RepID=UPI00061E797D|nr:type VI secretion system protein TssA [Pseudomonas sp. 10-1B]KIY40777.1 type VI secretion protein [Pseudomonas sp. 10-1B]
MSLQKLVERCLAGADPLLVARQHAQCWEPWLQPIPGDSPVGQDPGYEDDFQRMREEVNKLSGADAEQVVQAARKLLETTSKDLRIATYYLWARLHNDGETGLADGLSLLAALVERFASQVLPARATARKAALEWLASSKVLDSLSLYPQVVKAEAERTVAALVWLEHGLSAWPPAHRPHLAPLYNALTVRLVQAGGVDAIVPQTSAEHAANSKPVGPGAAPIKSGRDLLDSARNLARYLRDQPDGWLAAHRLMKSLRWDTVHQLPAQDAHGITRLAPPRGESRARLQRLYVQQSWGELLEQVECLYAEGVNHFWLDLQWCLHQALSKSPAPQNAWASIVRDDLGMLLQRLPGLEALRWSDGTAFADETTRDWINQHVTAGLGQQWLPAAAASPAEAGNAVLALEHEALAQADTEGVEQALAWLAARPELDSGRQRWLLRLVMARVAEQHGKSELALNLFCDLDASAQRHALDEWEPALCFEVKARLLKLLRAKTLRNDADRPALARQIEAQLAALVALDPVRAAVLCG